MRWAIIGCGMVSMKYHIPALKKIAHENICALVDKDKEWAQMLAKQFSIERYCDDYRGIKEKEVDAVLIATPNAMHAEIACHFLEQGINVLCDKPVGLSVNDVRQIFQTAKSHNARFMAGHTRRFGKNVQLVRFLVKNDIFQSPMEVQISLGVDIKAWNSRDNFRLKPTAEGGGVLFDTGVHILDQAIWYFGTNPISVEYRSTSHFSKNGEDEATIRLEYKNENVAVLSCSLVRGLAGNISVTSPNGWIKTKFNDPSYVSFFSRDSLVCKNDAAQIALLDVVDVYKEQLEHFCQCLHDGSEFLVKEDEVLASVEIIEHCHKHGITGKWQKVI
jgi:predicted dehydrogenase